jgi:hypothetical protein
MNSVGCYINRNSVMFPPALGSFGNSGRGLFRDSGYRDWDLSVNKNWKIKERLTAQFRAELFNVLNHPTFGNPAGVLGSGPGYNNAAGGAAVNFGCGCATADQVAPNPVVGSGANRAMQLGVKLIF